MKKYIEIVNNYIQIYDVDFPISPAEKILPQIIKIDEILLIGWAVRLLGDDEAAFLVIINNKKDIIPICGSYFVTDKEFKDNFNKRFNTQLYSEKLNELDPYDSKGKSIIIYPSTLFGKPLYKENFSGVLPFLHSMARSVMLIKLGKGILTDECKEYLKKQEN
ncbi:MAG: hypothetical protein IT238_07710 [Bacteroidia bacterium]|nr:hypothetical protein [Bacteroidia bacterium]